MLAKILHFIIWPFANIFFRVFLKFKAIGVENLKGLKGPVIFVSNHESYFDPFLISAGIPWFSSLHPVHYLAHDSMFNKKFLAAILPLLGSFPGRAYKGDESTFKIPSNLLSKKTSIGIFKEWCYKTNPGRGYVSKMVSTLSMRNNVAVVPVFTYGIYDGGISLKKILRRKREIKVIFGQPIHPKQGDNEDALNNLIQKAFLDTKLTFIKLLHEEEKRFWNGYAQFYHYLEESVSYQDLVNEVKRLVPDNLSGKWIDLGSGSGGIVNILKQKSGLKTEILATEIDPTMLKHLTERFTDSQSIKIKPLDLALPLDLPNNYFDGVTANLVLPYIMYHHGEIGRRALVCLLKDVYKMLKPGGVFIWSTPKHNVNFFHVFLASWKNIIDIRHPKHIYYGPAILTQALRIQRKGKTGVYSFLKTDELKSVLEEIGFKNINLTRSMAKQVDVISCQKDI